jgi:hypothetical protein
MATCNLSAGRNEVCKDSIGGLQAVYFLNYTSASFDETASDLAEISGFPSGSTVYKYELKGTSAYTETVNTSRENGTTFYSQEVVLNLKRLTNEMTTQLKLMAAGRPQIVVHTKNGESLLVGKHNGADVTAGTIQTGAGLGDLFGYSITLTGEERLPAAFLSGSTESDPFAAFTGDGLPTIVVGSGN